MTDTIYIFGCGGHARSIVNAIKGAEENKDLILVDPNCREGERILGCRTLLEDIFWKEQQNRMFEFVVGIGDNQKRRQMYERAIQEGGIPRKVFSRSATFGLECKVGKGVFVAEKAYLGPEVEVGNNAIINTGCVVEHETRIGSHTHIAPGSIICGRCRIGDNVFLGAGSTVIDGKVVVDDVVIGAGSVVVRDILEKGTYIGCPARKRI